MASDAETVGTDPQTAKAGATRFLLAALADHPLPATQVSRMAHEHGLTARAVRSARETLDVRVVRVGYGRGGQWLWSLPKGHPSEEGASASPEEHTMSETHQPTIDGYAVVGLSDESCTYCGKRGGPVHPMQAQSGPVFMMEAQFRGGGRERLHELCAMYLRDFYRAIDAKRAGQV
jgi:hypothetical protein